MVENKQRNNGPFESRINKVDLADLWGPTLAGTGLAVISHCDHMAAVCLLRGAVPAPLC